MKTMHMRERGFSLIEALVALFFVVLGLHAAATMQASIFRGAGDAKLRTKAIAVAEANLESARSIAIRGDFDAIAANCAAASTDPAFAVGCTVTTPAGGLDQRLVQVTVTWTDTAGAAQRVALNSLLGWDNVATLIAGNSIQAQPSIAPLGAARTGVGQYTPIPDDAVENGDGSFLRRKDDGRLELIAGDGNILLYIDPMNGEEQDFVTVSGRVYFDQNAGNNAIPSSSDVKVRLSSEGVCLYDNLPANLLAASGGSNSYKYFGYTCYVGSGWYGNVGVTIDDDVSGQAGSPTICLGDPGFNSSSSNGTLTSAHAREASVRTFRGFKAFGDTYLSTGVASGSSYPQNGMPTPSQYPAFYPSVGNDYFNHHFLITRIQGQASCATKMAGGVFAQNSGKYFCIAPDNDDAADACPSVWPGFETEVGSGGTVNHSLTVAKSGTGDGLVSSEPAGVHCGTTCSGSFPLNTQVVLTATPANGSVFAGWAGGGCTGVGTCTVNMTATTTVVATFAGSAQTHTLSVTKTGAGAGVVTSVSPTTAINCGSACSAGYAANASVILTAAAASGSTFEGWGGACSGTGSCVVTMSSAQNVTASFSNQAPTSCNAQISGSRVDKHGVVTIVSPAGAGTCSGENSTANYLCTVSVPLNTVVTLRNSRTGPQTYSHQKGVGISSCGSITNVNFP